MKTRLILALLLGLTLYGQETAASISPVVILPQPEAAIIHVKTLTGDAFSRLVRLLEVFGARLTSDSQLRTIVVYAPKDVVAQVRRVVDELDKPGSEAAIGRNVDMTLTLLKCSTKPAGTGNALAAEIEPVARQLRAATQYKDIQVWDIVPLRIQEGRVALQELRLPGTATEAPAITTVRIEVLPEGVGTKTQGRYVRFSRLNLSFKIPVVTRRNSALADTSFTYQDISLHTAGDFIEGQKAVLGKVSGTEDDSAIFVVITLKVLD